MNVNYSLRSFISAVLTAFVLMVLSAAAAVSQGVGGKALAESVRLLLPKWEVKIFHAPFSQFGARAFESAVAPSFFVYLQRSFLDGQPPLFQLPDFLPLTVDRLAEFRGDLEVLKKTKEKIEEIREAASHRPGDSVGERLVEFADALECMIEATHLVLVAAESLQRIDIWVNDSSHHYYRYPQGEGATLMALFFADAHRYLGEVLHGKRPGTASLLCKAVQLASIGELAKKALEGTNQDIGPAGSQVVSLLAVAQGARSVDPEALRRRFHDWTVEANWQFLNSFGEEPF